MENWFKRNKEFLVPTAIAIFVILVLGGVGSFLNSGSNTEKEVSKDEAVETIEIPAEQKKKSGSGEEQGEKESQPETYYLEPGPGEILEAIDGLEPVALDEKRKDFPGLKVMWPLYFFKLEEEDKNKTYLHLDVSENGFGVTVLCDVDVNLYPEVLEAKSGDLLWVAGEIEALDTEGTGQFYIKTEQIRFGGTKDKPPPAPAFSRAVVETKAESPDEQAAKQAEVEQVPVEGGK